MKLFKNSERKLNIYSMIDTYKKIGMTIENLGRWKKWKDLSIGGRLAVKLDIYECEFNGDKFYLLSDSLDRLAAPAEPNKQEVFDWLKNHDFKPEKQWYIEDYGMSEEAYEEWNNA